MSGRILLVEDDALSLKLMRDLLEARGFETFAVSNGAEVLARATDLQPDLVVMDIGLPGLNGIEATRQLRRDPLTRATPVVAVTAYAMPGDEQRMLDAGCDAYLTKPLRFAHFLAVVEALAGQPPASGNAKEKRLP